MKLAAWFWEVLLLIALAFGVRGHWPWWLWALWTFLFGMQTWTIIHLQLKERRTKAILQGILTDAADRMEDTIRHPDDNRPYQRFMDKMHPLDREAFDRLYKDIPKCEKCGFPLYDAETGGGSNQCIHCGHIHLDTREESEDGRAGK